MKTKLIALALVLSACSVQENKVVNVPPKIPTTRSMNVGSQYGNFNTTSITVFTWPEWSEGEARENAEKVKTLSLEAEGTMKNQNKLTEEVGALYMSLMQKGCSELATGAIDPMTPIQWKPEALSSASAALRECQTLEGERLGRLARFSHLMMIGDEIKAIVDAKPETSGPNWKSIGVKSFIKINRDQGAVKVEIKLADFLRAKTCATTTAKSCNCEGNAECVELQIANVSYSDVMGSLRFTVMPNAEKGIRESYDFTLFRFDDYYQETQLMGHYGGDFVVKNGGLLVKKGSIALYGGFKPQKP